MTGARSRVVLFKLQYIRGLDIRTATGTWTGHPGPCSLGRTAWDGFTGAVPVACGCAAEQPGAGQSHRGARQPRLSQSHRT